MKSQAAEFATPRPSHWLRLASDAAHDFVAYAVFVRQLWPSRHHQAIVERLLYGDRLELILGWPDAGKSQWGVMFIEWTLGRNPNWRWLVASEVATGIATTIVSQIGDTIANNERYQMTFGQLRDPGGHAAWSSVTLQLRTYVSPAESARTRKAASPPPPPWLLLPDTAAERQPGVPPISVSRGRRPGLGHPNVKAVGWRTGYAGARAEGIMGDDLVSDRSSRSKAITQQVFDTLHQKLLARLTGDRQRCVIFGQHYANRDLYGLLRERGVVVFDNNPGREGLQALEPEAAA